MKVLVKIFVAFNLVVGPSVGDAYCQGQGPAVPDNLKVPKGSKLIYRTYAKGFQIYKCTRSTSDTSNFEWKFIGPLATLYSDSGYSNVVGTHYAGPTWAASDGSKVVAEKIQQATPDDKAIPWLLLRSVSNSGSGLFKLISFIQRVNTAGGKVPSAKPDRADQGVEKKIPYTAEYFFYQPE
jgi:hypothetical protein